MVTSVKSDTVGRWPRPSAIARAALCACLPASVMLSACSDDPALTIEEGATVVSEVITSNAAEAAIGELMLLVAGSGSLDEVQDRITTELPCAQMSAGDDTLRVNFETCTWDNLPLTGHCSVTLSTGSAASAIDYTFDDFRLGDLAIDGGASTAEQTDDGVSTTFDLMASPGSVTTRRVVGTGVFSRYERRDDDGTVVDSGVSYSGGRTWVSDGAEWRADVAAMAYRGGRSIPIVGQAAVFAPDGAGYTVSFAYSTSPPYYSTVFRRGSTVEVCVSGNAVCE